MSDEIILRGIKRSVLGKAEIKPNKKEVKYEIYRQRSQLYRERRGKRDRSRGHTAQEFRVRK